MWYTYTMKHYLATKMVDGVLLCTKILNEVQFICFYFVSCAFHVIPNKIIKYCLFQCH